MRKLALLILFLCPLASPAAPNITVTATSITILGTNQTISLTCSLVDPNQTGILRTGGTVVTNFSATTVTPGTTATCGPIFGNDVITDGFGNALTSYYLIGVSTVSNGIVASTPAVLQAYQFAGSGTFDLSATLPFSLGPVSPAGSVLGQNLTFTGTNTSTGPWTFGTLTVTSLTVSGTTTQNGSVQNGINLAYPVFTNTPPNASTAVRQFDQYCAPDTDGLRGCGWVLNKFANNGNDLTNFFMQAPWNPGLNIYNAGLSSPITSISRVTGTGVVTVNTASQVSLRPMQGDVIIAGVTGCATPPNGHFFPATVVSATQFTFIQAGPTESCTPSTGTASPPVRAQHFFTHNDTSNVQQQIWLWENDVLGDRTDQYGLIQMPAAGATGNAGSFGRLVFSSAPCTTVGCGVNTGEQGSSTGNFTYYGLLRANSINSDALNSVASFSLRNFASTRETFIHGGGSNGNGTWDVIFNSQRGLSSNGIVRFSLAGDGIIYSSASDGGALIPLQPFAGVIIPTGRAVNLTEGTATASAGTDTIWGDSTAHRLKMNNNNGGAVTVPALEVSDAWTGTESFAGNTVALTADWTCGTAGTVSSCVAATIIGSGGGVPLTFTLPLFARSYTLECDGVVGQATGVTANSWNLLTATNGASNVTASYSMNTAVSAMTGGATTDQASTTTTFLIGPTWTLGGTATKMPFHIWAKIEGASASGTVVSLQLVAPTVADLVTIYRGASCRVF